MSRSDNERETGEVDSLHTIFHRVSARQAQSQHEKHRNVNASCFLWDSRALVFNEKLCEATILRFIKELPRTCNLQRRQAILWEA